MSDIRHTVCGTVTSFPVLVRKFQLALLASVFLLGCGLVGCGPTDAVSLAATGSTSSGSNGNPDTLSAYTLTGDTSIVRDPSIVRQGGTYYSFSTDPPSLASPSPGPAGYLPVRCSVDKVAWQACGYVFSAMPEWVKRYVPLANGLWAPDISYFGGAYHLYYAASTLNSQISAIGLATNLTLDAASPDFKWVDRGEVLASTSGDDFNAIDPNILVDTDYTVWLTYGSYWSGIKQVKIDPLTGKLSDTDRQIYSLASRSQSLNKVIEGASVIHHGDFYYLFLSAGFCCEANYLDDDYEEILGRSRSVHGPFLDVSGVDLRGTGGTVVLRADADWNAPGGGSAYIDDDSGDSMIVFHAARLDEGGAAHLWLKQIKWQDDWPVLQ
jgi:arabinan endo-1,5-alpha-L-arabinosidase